jgi:hypothetical protein
MGLALQWAALKGGNLESICSVFKLRSTGRREEIPESDIVGVELPTGWSLVLFNRKTIKDELLQEFSSSGEVVSCFVEDHVMFGTASGWRNQGPIWSVTHDCEKGRFHLEIQGVVPSALEGIHGSMVRQQKAAGGEKADVDHIYDIPAELARELTGFRHDQDIPGMSGDAFEVLEPTKEASHGAGARGLFGRLFGKQGRQ